MKSKHCKRGSTSMSSPSAVTPALPLLPVTPLDGESGYLRWKESMLLRLHTLGLAHVLSEEKERPAAGEKQRARDDALCRGHILATLSDRLLPAYAHHATGSEVWRAVARTYDLDLESVSFCKAYGFKYDEGKPLLEQLAVLQALAKAGKLSDSMAAFIRIAGFPPDLVEVAGGPAPRMEEIWENAREQVVSDWAREIYIGERRTDRQGRSSPDDSRPLKRERR